LRRGGDETSHLKRDIVNLRVPSSLAICNSRSDSATNSSSRSLNALDVMNNPQDHAAEFVQSKQHADNSEGEHSWKAA
jgi:hypothetical protein